MLVLRELIVRELLKFAYLNAEVLVARVPEMYLLYHKRELTWWLYRRVIDPRTITVNMGECSSPVNTRYKMLTCPLYQGSKLYDVVDPHVLYTTAKDVIIQQKIIQQKTQGEYHENH